MVRPLAITSTAPLRLGLPLPCIVAICAGLLCASAVCAQDAAEAARQEQARKQTQQKKSRHVYTEDDLKRAKILTPEDAERAQLARTNSAPATNPETSAPLDAQSDEKQIPLGDAAREFREEKVARDSELALKKQPGFHLGLPATAVATPKPLGAIKPAVAPRIAAPKAPQITLWGSPSVPAAPRAIPNARRVSPFQPRPLVPASREPLAPRAPAVFPRTAAPRMVTVVPRPAAPKVALRAFPPKASSAAVVANPVAPRVLAAAPKVEISPVCRSAAAVAPVQPVVQPENAVTVRAGDSLWKLAKIHLGAGSRWQELAAANSAIVDPNRLMPGQQLSLPAASVRDSSPGKVTVGVGDSMWKLARTYLRHGSAWTCIAQANPGVRSPERLQIGQELNIPSSCHP